MENYVEETGEGRIGDENVSQQSSIEQGIEIEKIATQESIAEEVVIEESAILETDTIIEIPADNEVVDPRRPGLIKLMIGLTIASIATNLIIAGNPKLYGFLTIGFIWIAIGFKEFLFPKTPDPIN